MSIDSILAAVKAGDYAPQPEGISVLVVTTDPEVARQVAPLLARRLYPDRAFGPILHVGDVEPLVEVRGIEVVVEDLGPRGTGAKRR